MKILAALIMLTQIAYAQDKETYACQMEGSTRYFRIIENQPQRGMATIYSPTVGTPLRFSETTHVQYTKLAKETIRRKIYFHPFYEYQLTETTREYYMPTTYEQTLKGVYVSEMNPNKSFTCVRNRNSQ